MWTPILLALFAGGMLVYGLSTGAMPAGKVAPASKADDPGAYWMLAGFWAVAAVGSLIWLATML